jgi:hypothetical protein
MGGKFEAGTPGDVSQRSQRISPALRVFPLTVKLNDFSEHVDDIA